MTFKKGCCWTIGGEKANLSTKTEENQGEKTQRRTGDSLDFAGTSGGTVFCKKERRVRVPGEGGVRLGEGDKERPEARGGEKQFASEK